LEHTLRSLVSLAMALLGVSAIPASPHYDWPWEEQANIFWPGTLNVTWMNGRFNKRPFYSMNMGRFSQGHPGLHSFLIMVDDRWVRQTMYHDGLVHHEWRYVRTGIPQVMVQSLNPETLSSNYPNEWLLQDSFISVEQLRLEEEEAATNVREVFNRTSYGPDREQQ